MSWRPLSQCYDWYQQGMLSDMRPSLGEYNFQYRNNSRTCYFPRQHIPYNSLGIPAYYPRTMTTNNCYSYEDHHVPNKHLQRSSLFISGWTSNQVTNDNIYHPPWAHLSSLHLSNNQWYQHPNLFTERESHERQCEVGMNSHLGTCCYNNTYRVLSNADEPYPITINEGNVIQKNNLNNNQQQRNSIETTATTAQALTPQDRKSEYEVTKQLFFNELTNKRNFQHQTTYAREKYREKVCKITSEPNTSQSRKVISNSIVRYHQDEIDNRYDINKENAAVVTSSSLSEIVSSWQTSIGVNETSRLNRNFTSSTLRSFENEVEKTRNNQNINR